MPIKYNKFGLKHKKFDSVSTKNHICAIVQFERLLGIQEEELSKYVYMTVAEAYIGFLCEKLGYVLSHDGYTLMDEKASIADE